MKQFEVIVSVALVVLAAAFMYIGPSLTEFATRTLRSARARSVGMGVLHATHFDNDVRPSRATRRRMGRGLFAFWMLQDESGVVTFPKLKDAEGKLQAVRQELKEVFDEAGSDMDMDKVKAISGTPEEKVEWIRNKNKEAEDLLNEVGDLTMLARSAEIADAFDAGESGMDQPSDKRAGFVDMLFESAAIKNKPSGSDGPSVTIQLPETRQMRSTREQIRNALFETGAGWAPESTRAPRIDYAAEELPAVVDLVPMITTDVPLYKFMRETGFTNAAGETAEGGAYQEATLELEEAEEAVRKITVWIAATDEQLEDVPGARAYVESRLRFMLEQRLDQRLLYGNPAATPPQIRGFHNTTGINSHDATGEDIPDAVLMAMATNRVEGQAITDGVVLHPYDFTRVRLQRTSDGIYIWGHPSQAGPATLWGVKVVETASEVEGSGLVGAFGTQSLLVVRRGVDVQVSNSHSDFFIKGKQAIRADFRAALVTIRPPAFTELENIPAGDVSL